MQIQEHTLVGDIAAGSAAAATVLEKYGIDYCCGGKRTLEDACRETGVPAAKIRNELASAVADPATRAIDWNTASLEALIHHIVTTHHEYLKLELPRVGQRVRTVVAVHGEKDPAALHELDMVYQGMSEELNLHMHKEEMMLFPMIERMEAFVQNQRSLPMMPFGTIRNPIGVMEREHDSAGTALTRIRDLTLGFQAPPYACSTYLAMLEGLKALEADLHLHIHLENNILFPRAIALEQNAR
ncbi:MAG: iron-sulfur cluster repair di-iron protein [Acidobacteriota bacterium]|nr:iron-sulfur cluster repair di-iron protein [Acidobacteriota bacterium]